MNTTPTLTEQFRTVAQTVLDECNKDSSVQFQGVACYPDFYQPYAAYSKCGLHQINGETIESVIEKVKALPTKQQANADKIAALKAELAKLEAGQ